MTTDVVLTASLVGRAHARAGRACQDAAARFVDDDVVLAAVADGCSAAPGSALGAQLAARFLVVDGARLARRGIALSELPDALCDRLVRQVQRWARPLASPSGLLDFVAESFLFTFQVVATRGDDAVAFGVGDGCVVVGGAARALPCSADGAPDCAAYRLFPPERLAGAPRTSPVVHYRGRRGDAPIAVATDGLAPVVDALPGLVADDALARNPSLLEKRLRVLQRTAGLEDDATIAVVGGRA